MNMLEYLYDATKEKHMDTIDTKLLSETASYHTQKLRPYLNKYQWKLLLRIVDNKDLTAEIMATNRGKAYRHWFCLKYNRLMFYINPPVTTNAQRVLSGNPFHILNN